MRLSVREPHRHERPEHAQTAGRELRRQVSRLGRHEAPIAELGADVAGSRQLVEHLGERRLSLHAIEFQNSPGARRVRDSHVVRRPGGSAAVVCLGLASEYNCGELAARRSVDEQAAGEKPRYAAMVGYDRRG